VVGRISFLERDVAGGAGLDGEQRSAAERAAGAEINSLRVGDRRGVRRVAAHATAAAARGAYAAKLPQHLARGRVVGAHLLAAGDDLSPLAVLPDERRAPARLLVAIDAPQLLAVLLVQRHEERLLLIVALDEEPIAVERGRAAGAPAGHHLVGAQVLVPEE